MHARVGDWLVVRNRLLDERVRAGQGDAIVTPKPSARARTSARG